MIRLQPPNFQLEGSHEIKTCDAISRAGLRQLDGGPKQLASCRQCDTGTKLDRYAADRDQSDQPDTTDAASDRGGQSADGSDAASPIATHQPNDWGDAKFRESDDTDEAGEHALHHNRNIGFEQRNG